MTNFVYKITSDMPLRLILLIGLNTAVAFSGFSQVRISWDILSDVKFEEKYVASSDEYYLFPTFGPKIKTFNGKKVLITGYVIPLDPDGKVYFLSKFPYASCFFCGQAGPETILELQLAGDKKHFFTLDQIVTFEGILELNSTDIEHCNYVLSSARAQ